MLSEFCRRASPFALPIHSPSIVRRLNFLPFISGVLPNENSGKR
jgi:hypothetical protein